MEELRDKIADIAKQKFNNLKAELDGVVDQLEHVTNMVNKFMDQAETRGYLLSKKYYETLIKNEQAKIGSLSNELTQLQNSLREAITSGAIKPYSADWYEMQGAINSVEEALQDAKNAVYEYQKAMRELDWKVFEIQDEYLSRIQDEADFLIELMSNDKLVNDDGSFTGQGKATIGMHFVDYDNYMYRADLAAAEIKKLNEELAKDPNNMDIIAQRNKMIDQQQEMILNAEKEKQAIKELVEQAYNDMLEALKKIIDKRKEALEAAKDLYEYEKKVKEQTKEISSLQKQMTAYSGDNSEEAKAKIQQLKVQLEEAQQNLEETEYEQWLKDQEQLMDDFYNQVEEWLNSRLDDIEVLMQDMIDMTNASAEEIYTTIKDETQAVGYTLTDEMDNIWAEAAAGLNDAVTLYDTNFKNYSATALTTMDGIKALVARMQDWATQLANQLISTIQAGVTAICGSIGAGASTGNYNTGGGTPGSGDTDDKDNKTSAPKKTRYYVANPTGTKVSIYFDTEEQAQIAKDYITYGLDGKIKEKFKIKEEKYHTGLEKGLVGSDGFKYDDFELLQKLGADEVPAVLQKGEAVMTQDQMHNIANAVRLADYDAGLYQMQQKFISSALGDNGIMPGLMSSASRAVLNSAGMNNAGTVNNEVTLNLALPNVTDVDSFITELQHNNRFEKIVQSMTLGTAMGRNSMNKYKY